MGHVRPAAERPQSRAPQQLLEGTEREVANVSGRARTGVELDVVRRATEDELCAAAERHQVEQPSARAPRQQLPQPRRARDVKPRRTPRVAEAPFGELLARRPTRSLA